MNNINISSLNGGGGNNYNIIRLLSYNFYNNISSSDLNGSIDKDLNIFGFWNKNIDEWCINNTNENAYFTDNTSNILRSKLGNKNSTRPDAAWNDPAGYRLIIEYKE